MLFRHVLNGGKWGFYNYVCGRSPQNPNPPGRSQPPGLAWRPSGRGWGTCSRLSNPRPHPQLTWWSRPWRGWRGVGGPSTLPAQLKRPQGAALQRLWLSRGQPQHGPDRTQEPDGASRSTPGALLEAGPWSGGREWRREGTMLTTPAPDQAKGRRGGRSGERRQPIGCSPEGTKRGVSEEWGNGGLDRLAPPRGKLKARLLAG